MVHSNGQTWLEFGKGDVDLRVSYDGDCSLVILENAPTPRKIGVWEKRDGSEIDADRFAQAPAIMSFTNVESIDAVIYSLTKAKEAFQKFCGKEALTE